MYYQYDDILNVFGYLQSRNETLDQAFARLARGVEDLDVRLDKLDGDIADVKAETDDLLARAFALAKSMGIDVSDLEAKPKSLSLVPAKKEEPLLTDRKIILPPDIDYRAEFEKLVDQAHAAGFTAVQPTDVLTAEELRRADAVSRQLDEAFSSATRLKGKDLAVLWIAVALRVIIYFMYHKFRAAVPDVPLSADAPQSQEIAPKGKKKLLSREVKEKANEVKDTADNLIQVLILGKGIQTKMLDSDTILAEPVPFEAQAGGRYQKKDILAYNPWLGWFMGVANILTDTVTVKQFKSYAVERSDAFRTGEEVDTFLGIAYPVIKNLVADKDAVIAATLREAILLDQGGARQEQVLTLFNRATALEKKAAHFADEIATGMAFFTSEWAELVGGIATTVLINSVISAIHSVMYREEDGPLDLYALRTSRILTYSGAIATSLNSLPALATENIMDLDFAGILTTCLSLFQSTKFWLEAKTNFLTSAYRQKLDQELVKIDRFFE